MSRKMWVTFKPKIRSVSISTHWCHLPIEAPKTAIEAWLGIWEWLSTTCPQLTPRLITGPNWPPLPQPLITTVHHRGMRQKETDPLRERPTKRETLIWVKERVKHWSLRERHQSEKEREKLVCEWRTLRHIWA